METSSLGISFGSSNRPQSRQPADPPIAALLSDLEQRGYWMKRLICGGEFGRTPAIEIQTGGNQLAVIITITDLQFG